MIIRLMGGLGNQMYQYALGKKIEFLHKNNVKYDTFSLAQYSRKKFELQKFNTSITQANKNEIHFLNSNKYICALLKKFEYLNFIEKSFYFEKKNYEFDPNVLMTKANYVYGYWQSYKYFDDIKNILLRNLTLIEPLDLKNKEILKKIKSLESVSIHIRRGDYIKESKNTNGLALLPLKYYENALSYINSKINNLHFFVFSDDISWVKSNIKIKSNVTYINNNIAYPEKDFILMKSCNHNIIANSSFSWWGAYLNTNINKIVLIPFKWMNNLETPQGLLPENFHKIMF